MKTSLTFSIASSGTSTATDTRPRASRRGTLEGVSIGTSVRVVAMSLERDEAEWLRAIGFFEGQTMTLLRRAIFGGPIHVRAASGGEFAVDRSLALRIDVEPCEPV